VSGPPQPGDFLRGDVLPNPDGALRAAMYANVQIEVPAGGEPVMTVPSPRCSTAARGRSC
jgi:hypothetical protein